MKACSHRAVFLDRDGVLNEAIVRNGRPYPPAGIAELQICTEAAAALELLRKAGFLRIVVTNQPDVARMTQTREAVEAIHAVVGSMLPIDEFRICWHDDSDECRCRKPKPGLLLAAAHDWSIDLAQSFLVGDRWRDIEAGAAAGCRTILIDRHYDEKGPKVRPDYSTEFLLDAVKWIIATAQSNPADGA